MVTRGIRRRGYPVVSVNATGRQCEGPTMKRYLVAAVALALVTGLCYAQGRAAARKPAEDKAKAAGPPLTPTPSPQRGEGRRLAAARPICVLVPAIDRGEMTG